MHDDYGRGYIPDHYGWAVKPQPAPKSLSSDELIAISAFLDGLDESGAEFSGTVRFNEHSFTVGYNDESDEHYIVVP
jgi:hypothetical protein